ncbi:MAG: GTP-binding protein [Clostridium sp.]
MLYTTGTTRKLGRVDNRDAYLDTYALERERGITIFSKQAVCRLGDVTVTLLDTPGHVDFSAEMERTLNVLDYAVLVISESGRCAGAHGDAVEPAKAIPVPTFLFINKMDQPGTDREVLLSELQKRLSESCVDFALLDGKRKMCRKRSGRPSPCRRRSFWSSIWKMAAFRSRRSAG